MPASRLRESVAYDAAKAGLSHMAGTIAAELARYRINVNVIEPGWIDTPGEHEAFGDEVLREAGPKLPWGRLGVPEDIGKAAAFLASDDADYITGTALLVDGGILLRETALLRNADDPCVLSIDVRCAVLLLTLFVARRGASQAATAAAEHRLHPRGRPRILRPRLLWRRDRDPEPRCPGGGRVAVHAVLQHRAVLAVARGAVDGLLLRSRSTAIRAGSGPRWAALLPDLLRPAGYRSYHSGKWHVDGPVLAGGFERSYLVVDQDRHFSPRNHQLDDQPAAAAEARGRLLRHRRHRTARDRRARRARRRAPRRSVLPLPRIHGPALPPDGACRGHRALPRQVRGRLGRAPGAPAGADADSSGS